MQDAGARPLPARSQAVCLLEDVERLRRRAHRVEGEYLAARRARNRADAPERIELDIARRLAPLSEVEPDLRDEARLTGKLDAPRRILLAAASLVEPPRMQTEPHPHRGLVSQRLAHPHVLGRLHRRGQRTAAPLGERRRQLARVIGKPQVAMHVEQTHPLSTSFVRAVASQESTANAILRKIARIR